MARLNAKWNNFTQRGQTWDHFWQDSATAGVAYEFSGDVTLTFGVSAALAVTHAEPAVVAITTTVAATIAVTYTEPASTTLVFTVDSSLEYVAGPTDYSATGDVTLTFTVDSAFQFVSGAVARRGSYRSFSPRPPEPMPITYDLETSASLSRFTVAARMVFSANPGSAVAIHLWPHSPRMFINVPFSLEEEMLLLVA